MSVFLSPVGGAGAQFFDGNGNPLSGGKLYTYGAGTTTPQATYTSSAGVTLHSNPIILDAAGRVPGSSEIWLADNAIYKFVLKDSNDVLQAAWDQITGINSNFVNYTTETEVQTATAGQTVFTLTSVTYQPGTGNLTVFVDGVNQYEGTSYLETDGTTVTFTAGLHIGALVKFTTAVQTTGNATDASVVVYDPPFTGSVATTVENKLAQYISVLDFGADPTGTTDSTVAIQAAIDSIPNAGAGAIWFPKGTYNVSNTIDTNNRTVVFMGGNSTIHCTASISYVFQVTDVGCRFENFFFTKAAGVTASAFLVSGIRHVFDNIQSGDALWTYFFHLQDVKESKFANLNIYLDSATQTGQIFRLDYSVNNTISDSFLGYCEHGIYATSTPQPVSGYKSEGWLMTNVIIVYAKKAMTLDTATLFSVENCCFDFCEIWGIFQSNGNNLKVMNTWIASNTTNGFIGVGTVNTVYGVSVVGNVFVRGASAITGTAGVSLSGPNALVVGNSFQGGMNGGIVTDTGSQVIGNTVSSPGTNIVANLTNSTILGTLSVAANLSVAGSKGIFPQGVSGSASTQVGGATLPALARGFITVEFDDGAGIAQYKIPYYNV